MYANGGLKVARDVRVGDRMSSGLVRNVRRVVRKGLYNPQTESGVIMVDGIVVSCYTEAIQPIVAHALLSWVRGGGRWCGELVDFVSGGVHEGRLGSLMWASFV